MTFAVDKYALNPLGHEKLRSLFKKVCPAWPQPNSSAERTRPTSALEFDENTASALFKPTPHHFISPY